MLFERVAIVHDWLTSMRGGERVVEALLRVFPRADLFTLTWNPARLSAALAGRRAITSVIDRVAHAPLMGGRFRGLLPFFPAAVESFDLAGYDLVISSSHCVAIGALAPPGALHVAYVHSTLRYVREGQRAYEASVPGGVAGRALFRSAARSLRKWETAASARPHELIANSTYTRDRILRYYGRDARVIEPPIDTARFERAASRAPGTDGRSPFLVVSALVPNKRVDLALRAFQGRRERLIVVGEGPERRRLEPLIGPNVTLLPRVDDEALADLLAGCRALLHTGVDDFGMVMVEALAAGKPVVACAEGGALDIVRDGETGVLVESPTVHAVRAALDRFDRLSPGFDPAALRRVAKGFDSAHFERRFAHAVEEALRRRRDESPVPVTAGGDGERAHPPSGFFPTPAAPPTATLGAGDGSGHSVAGPFAHMVPGHAGEGMYGDKSGYSAPSPMAHGANGHASAGPMAHAANGHAAVRPMAHAANAAARPIEHVANGHASAGPMAHGANGHSAPRVRNEGRKRRHLPLLPPADAAAAIAGGPNGRGSSTHPRMDLAGSAAVFVSSEAYEGQGALAAVLSVPDDAPDDESAPQAVSALFAAQASPALAPHAAPHGRAAARAPSAAPAVVFPLHPHPRRAADPALVESHVARHSTAALRAKRLADVAIAASGLAFTAPLMAALGAVISLTSPGPALFTQHRTGLDQRPFVLVKLRTMDSHGNVTPVGRFLRPLGLDELPQLWNVLKGDMSVVGPRPELPHLVAEFERRHPGFRARHLMRPGITGWAQVNGLRGNANLSIAERLRFDVQYLCEWDLMLDARILARTLSTVLGDTIRSFRR